MAVRVAIPMVAYQKNAPLAQRLAHYLDTVGVTGSNPVGST